MSDRELTGESVDQIETDGKRDVDANQVEDTCVVRVELEVAESMLEQVVQAEQDAYRGGRREDLRRHPHANDAPLDLLDGRRAQDAGRPEKQNQDEYREGGGVAVCGVGRGAEPCLQEADEHA